MKLVKKKICWKITTRCNQGCKYCFGFSNIKELDYFDNKKVLDNMIKDGLESITWTGGEAVMYPRINDLVKISKENNLYNKLVTNGIYISQNIGKQEVDELLDNLDCIALSIDSVSNSTNIALGKEEHHYEIIKKILDYTKAKDIKVNIHTVVSQKNIDQLRELGKFLNNYKIDNWKFLKFMPIRERAEENKNLFEITDSELTKAIDGLDSYENINNIRYKRQKDLEDSFVILPNADIIKTEDGIDIKKGNAQYDNVIKCIEI